MSILPILPWNKPAKIAMGTGSVLATAALISGVVLMILKGNSPLSLGLTCGGAATLTLAGLYSSIAACSKRGPSDSQPDPVPDVVEETITKKIAPLENMEQYESIDKDRYQEIIANRTERKKFARAVYYKTVNVVIDAIQAKNSSVTETQLQKALGFSNGAMGLFVKERLETLSFGFGRQCFENIQDHVIDVCKSWGMDEKEAVPFLPEGYMKWVTAPAPIVNESSDSDTEVGEYDVSGSDD